jgi:hypothetical protein
MENKILVVIIEDDPSDYVEGLASIVIPANSHYRIQRFIGLSLGAALAEASEMMKSEGCTHLFVVNRLG